MKTGVAVVALLLVGSAAHAESLADAAKRERERREKNKATGVEVKVIDAEELAEVPTDGGKGTFNVGTNGNERVYSEGNSTSDSSASASRSGSGAPSGSGRGGRSPIPGWPVDAGREGSSAGSAAPSAPSPQGPSVASPAPSSNYDPKREAARKQLAAAYGRIAANAVRFVRYAEAYDGCPPEASIGTKCHDLLRNLAHYAVKVALDMEEAENQARRGSLAPGEVRRMRQSHGMDDAYWDRLVRFVQEHRYR